MFITQAVHVFVFDKIEQQTVHLQVFLNNTQYIQNTF